MRIKTDEAQPKNDVVKSASAKPKGMGADRQPEPMFNPDGLSDAGSYGRKGKPRN